MNAREVALDSSDDTEQILDERARDLALVPDEHETLTELHLVVRIGEHRLGLAAARARHVSAPRPLTAVPAAPDAIVGAAPVLGELVAVVDLGALLGATAERPHDQCHLVVIDDGDETLGLLVDEVEDLIDVDVARMGSVDHALGGLTGTVAEGVRLLDLEALLADPRLSPTKPSADPARGEP